MRNQFVFLFAALLGAGAVGCFAPYSYDEVFRQGDGGAAGSGGAGGGGGTATTTTSSVPIECIPSGSSAVVADDCGVFVSTDGSDDTGEGTREKPYATIGRALTEAGTIYVCADPEKPYQEAVVVGKAGLHVFGGLSCETWMYDAAIRTLLTAKPGEVPLRLLVSGSLRIEDFTIFAADAPALAPGEHVAGRSSVAIFAETVSHLDMARCDVTAGRGSDGAHGEPPMGTGTSGPDGEDGVDGCVQPMNVFPGSGGQNVCTGLDVAGGLGGTGTTTASGGAGSHGQPVGFLGEGGLGQTAAVTCATGGTGEDGLHGLSGDPGKGAVADTPGILSATGVLGVRGSDGAPGQPGQGGGGGGGARACSNGNSGPSGAGGGAGGCGGAGGKGGYPGGSSIGIASLGATLTFNNVTITVSAGGSGGFGASGQDGGPGGVGGMPGAGDANAIACPGAKGGTGGKGGRGGGGLGGHSIGIAHTGEAPSTEGALIMPGTAGSGGTGDGPDGTAAEGLTQQVQAF